MKILMLYDYPACPSGLATQGELLKKGLEIWDVEVRAVNLKSAEEKEWYYRWFQPDLVIGIGYWGHIPDLVVHPLKFGILAVPWLVADGFVANYHDVLNSLPLILVTSNWVKEMYIRDGINPENIKVLPVPCDTDSFLPRDLDDSRVKSAREAFALRAEDVFILTVGGDAASKGAREIMRGLAGIKDQTFPWKYVCKVWPQERTFRQNLLDRELAVRLKIESKVHIRTSIVSRHFMPFLVAACDIYAAPSRLEGYGMCQVEAGSCGKPVIGMKAMGMLDTLIHGRTAFMAEVGQEKTITEAVLGSESGYPEGNRIKFDSPRTAEYRADVEEIRKYLTQLICNPSLREEMGNTAREHVISNFSCSQVAKRFLNIISEQFGI